MMILRTRKRRGYHGSSFVDAKTEKDFWLWDAEKV